MEQDSDRKSVEGENDLNKYLKDLELIREIVQKNQENPVIEFWGFIVWGVLIIIGTVVNYFSSTQWGFDMNRNFLTIWVPILIVGGTSESLSWLLLFKRRNKPLLTKKMVHFLVNATSMLITASILLYYVMHHDGPVPGLILLLYSQAIFFVAQASYQILYVYAATTISISFIFIALALTGPIAFLLVGLLAGANFIIIGIHSRILELNSNE